MSSRLPAPILAYIKLRMVQASDHNDIHAARLDRPWTQPVIDPHSRFSTLRQTDVSAHFLLKTLLFFAPLQALGGAFKIAFKPAILLHSESVILFSGQFYGNLVRDPPAIM